MQKTSADGGRVMYKIIGVIGGMGPAATADLLNKITDVTDAKNDQEHVRVIIDSNINIPDRTEAILHGGADPLPELKASAELLEKAGADMIIIACNTAHYYLPELQESTPLPIISMPAETARLLKEKGVKKAAVLATDGTVKSSIDKFYAPEVFQALKTKMGAADGDLVLLYNDRGKVLCAAQLLPLDLHQP